MTVSRHAKAAVVGLGFSAIAREPIGDARTLARAAVLAAVADAGLPLGAVDGLIVTRSPSASRESLPLTLARELGMPPQKLLCAIDAEGASAIAAVQHATLALHAGMANAVLCVFADARVDGRDAGGGFAKAMPLSGVPGWEEKQGLFGPVGAYALAARRWLFESGATPDDLGAYAIACRAWAVHNPQAMARTPLTMAAYLESRLMVEPLRVLDCAFAVNGAIAVLLVRGDEAGRHAGRPVYVHGMGQCHIGETGRAPRAGEVEPSQGAAPAAADACRMAGIALGDIGMAQLYDPFSSVGLQLLEAYGLCARGEAGALVREGHTSPGGRLPVNTGGGHLSGHYLQGMTPIAEAVTQARGAGGGRQVASRAPILVGGIGGRMNHHATLVMSGEAVLA